MTADQQRPFVEESNESKRVWAAYFASRRSQGGSRAQERTRQSTPPRDPGNLPGWPQGHDTLPSFGSQPPARHMPADPVPLSSQATGLGAEGPDPLLLEGPPLTSLPEVILGSVVLPWHYHDSMHGPLFSGHPLFPASPALHDLELPPPQPQTRPDWAALGHAGRLSAWDDPGGVPPAVAEKLVVLHEREGPVSMWPESLDRMAYEVAGTLGLANVCGRR